MEMAGQTGCQNRGEIPKMSVRTITRVAGPQTK